MAKEKAECTALHTEDDKEDTDGITLKGIIIAAVLLTLALMDKKGRVLSQFMIKGEGAIYPLLGDLDNLFCMLSCLVSYLICGKGVVLGAIKGIISGHVFDERFLMTIASLGSAVVGEYPEAVAVMLLYQVGEYFEGAAEDSSRNAIKSLMSIKPDTACVKRRCEEITINADEVEIGEVIIVKAGERVPIDGTVIKGRSFLDTKAITGESVPVRVLEGSEVMAGSINSGGRDGGGVIEITTVRKAGESAAARIIALVSESAEKKAKSEKFITVFSRIYTPVVCMAAVAIAIIPSIITGDIKTWIYRALIFLVVSCPCALVISVPLSFVAGLGRASRLGVLIKGGEYIESLSRTKVAVFDKTGTLTRGTFCVTAVHVAHGALLPNADDETKTHEITEEELIALAAHAETYSNHPVSRSIRNAHSCPRCSLVRIEDAAEIAGEGIAAVIDGKLILAGNEKLMQERGVEGFIPCPMSDSGTVVHVAVSNIYAGHIVISDETKKDAAKSIARLRKLGIKKVVMLTGDREDAARGVASETGIDEVYSRLLPQDKVKRVEELLDALKGYGGKAENKSTKKATGNKTKGISHFLCSNNKRGTLLFAGDGINDAPVLTLADTGIAMGALGSDAAVEAADVVVMTDEIERVADAVKVSKDTMRIVRQNIVLAIGVKAVIMLLGAAGLANMWLAVFGDTGVALLATVNALRGAKR